MFLLRDKLITQSEKRETSTQNLQRNNVARLRRGKFETTEFHSENASNVFRPHFASHFGLVLEENSGREVKWLSGTSSFSKSSVFKMVPVHTKTQNWRFKFLRFEERFFKSSVFVTD